MVNYCEVWGCVAQVLPQTVFSLPPPPPPWSRKARLCLSQSLPSFLTPTVFPLSFFFFFFFSVLYLPPTYLPSVLSLSFLYFFVLSSLLLHLYVVFRSLSFLSSFFSFRLLSFNSPPSSCFPCSLHASLLLPFFFLLLTREKCDSLLFSLSLSNLIYHSGIQARYTVYVSMYYQIRSLLVTPKCLIEQTTSLFLMWVYFPWHSLEESVGLEFTHTSISKLKKRIVKCDADMFCVQQSKHFQSSISLSVYIL